MTAREWLLALLLAIAAALVTAGVADVSSEAGMVIGGILLAAWAWLVLGEVAE